ncbi:OmpA family protein [Croceitalea vernalis]|uniref:OmpA family protein n=1 Tax=Croceitalea vernalis TaxID=3075599 RepID=A0ABU3BKN7_9FLAO|nr:OmpA family protein [Croceitalea sp. P007]MDT0622675.1 OmpA family protein [Croceitalea sp. P007]
MKLLKTITLLFIFSTGIYAQTTICPDVEGAEQHPLLSSYKNSCIVGYNVTKFDMVTLPISKITYEGAEKELTVEGKVTDILYGIESSQSTTILEVQRNYEQALKSSGLEIIYSAFGKKGVMNNNSAISREYESIASTEYLGSFKFLKDKDYRLAFNYLGRNKDNELAYFVAQGKRNGIDYTLMLYINYGRGNSELIEDKIFIQAKIIESESMETGQVSILSIDEKIKNEGKEIFHNILFDFGSDKLTENSYDVIKTLSDYLKANPNQEYYIVGHTDNVGSLSANQTLSEKRAKAVSNALTTKYGINESQISAHGVGQLSPLTINTTEEGRALNRRVEIVLK